MARLALNKSSLHRESRHLSTYERFLPSLDLKRRQLIAKRAEAAAALRRTRESIQEVKERVRTELPMLAAAEVRLPDPLVRVAGVDLGEENLLGVRLPLLRELRFAVADYSLLATPHWVDALVARLKEALELAVRAHIEERRLANLEGAVKRTTQRVNLFDKVLIPRARANIRRIEIYLADAERAGVVRAKIAKRKHAGESIP
jgi:V/A-type H+-transporting ATPase subunit D